MERPILIKKTSGIPFIAHPPMFRIEQPGLQQHREQHYARSLINSEQKGLITDFGLELKAVSSCF